jgi:hypothetical protein
MERPASRHLRKTSMPLMDGKPRSSTTASKSEVSPWKCPCSPSSVDSIWKSRDLCGAELAQW